MASVQDALDAIAKLKTDVEAEVQALKDQIASGQAVEAADLDKVLAAVNAVDAENLPPAPPAPPAP